MDGRQAGLASTNDAVRQPLLHFEESLGGVCVSKVDKHSITVKLQIRAETPHPAVLKQISKSPFVSVSLRPFDFDASKQQTVMACVPYSGSGKEGGRGRGVVFICFHFSPPSLLDKFVKTRCVRQVIVSMCQSHHRLGSACSWAASMLHQNQLEKQLWLIT